MGAQGHYTMLSEALFRQLIGQPEGGEGEALALLAPVQGEISGTFGVRIHPVSQEQKANNGIDFAGQVGDSVVASADGTVVEAGWDETYGNYIRLDHGNGVQTFYGSNQELLVQKGEQAAQGQSIARLGSTGKSTGPHCHCEVWVQGRPFDPTDYLTYSTESGERRPADPMIWVYEPARSSVFPALPVEFDPNVAGDGEKIGGIQVSAGGGTFYRHDESKYPNYQDQGYSCQYLQLSGSRPKLPVSAVRAALLVPGLDRAGDRSGDFLSGPGPAGLSRQTYFKGTGSGPDGVSGFSGSPGTFHPME